MCTHIQLKLKCTKRHSWTWELTNTWRSVSLLIRIMLICFVEDVHRRMMLCIVADFVAPNLWISTSVCFMNCSCLRRVDLFNRIFIAGLSSTRLFPTNIPEQETCRNIYKSINMLRLRARIAAKSIKGFCKYEFLTALPCNVIDHLGSPSNRAKWATFFLFQFIKNQPVERSWRCWCIEAR